MAEPTRYERTCIACGLVVVSYGPGRPKKTHPGACKRQIKRAAFLRMFDSDEERKAYNRAASRRKRSQERERGSACGCGQDYLSLPLDHRCTNPVPVPAAERDLLD